MPDDAAWQAVDDYIVGALIGDDEALAAALAANEAAGLPAIDVSPAQGKMLNLLVRMAGARRILEIGTLGGYSTIWMARALPEDGRIVTLELDPHHAEVARANLERAGLLAKADIRVGRAVDTLAAMTDEEPFDFIFIDADKPGNPAYLRESLRLSRPGTVLVLDNVVRKGGVIRPDDSDPSVQGARAGLECLGREPRFDATAIQTVGAKGWDGFAIAIVK